MAATLISVAVTPGRAGAAPAVAASPGQWSVRRWCRRWSVSPTAAATGAAARRRPRVGGGAIGAGDRRSPSSPGAGRRHARRPPARSAARRSAERVVGEARPARGDASASRTARRTRRLGRAAARHRSRSSTRDPPRRGGTSDRGRTVALPRSHALEPVSPREPARLGGVCRGGPPDVPHVPGARRRPSSAVYAISATGLVVTYITSGVFNFAHGAIGMFLAFVYWELRVNQGWPTPLALLVTLGVCAPIIGVLLDVLVMRRLLRGASVATKLVVTLALLLAFQGAGARRAGASSCARSRGCGATGASRCSATS